jgi:hypothetical protein
MFQIDKESYLPILIPSIKCFNKNDWKVHWFDIFHRNWLFVESIEEYSNVKKSIALIISQIDARTDSFLDISKESSGEH